MYRGQASALMGVKQTKLFNTSNRRRMSVISECMINRPTDQSFVAVDPKRRSLQITNEDLIDKAAPVTPELRMKRKRRSAGLYPCVDPIVRLVAETFDCSMAAVMMLDTAFGRVVSSHGALPTGSRKATFCFWCLLSGKSTALIIENAAKHPAHWSHPVVTKEPQIRFYAGVPLSTKDGTVIGVLCVADQRPKCVNISCDLERFGKIVASRIGTETVLPIGDCLGVCDLASPDWSLLHCDNNLKKALNTQYFSLKSVVRQEDIEYLSLPTVLKSAPQALRLKENTGLDCGGFSIQSCCEAVDNWAFFRLVINAPSRQSYKKDIKLPLTMSRVPFEDMTFGECLGRGSYGIVYSALWRDKPVAVKIVPSSNRRIQDEVNIGIQLSHPNVVKTLASETTRHSDDEETWIVLELCAGGSLQNALFNKAAYLHNPSAVYRTSLDIARGLHHLHDRSILHGDLTGNNVLLSDQGVAKLSDFGLSRKFGGATQQTEQCGTLTYMPPELLKDGLISKAMDIYSLGVLMWELSTGDRAFANMRPGHIMSCKIFGKLRLSAVPSHPKIFNDLILDCVQDDYKQRPSISIVVRVLEKTIQTVKTTLKPTDQT